MLLRLGFKVSDIDIAVIITFDHDNLHACHDCTRWIRSVRGFRDQADRSTGISIAQVITSDGQHPRVFALRASIRLQRYCRKPSDLSNRILEFLEHLEIALGLLLRCKWMKVAELWPR